MNFILRTTILAGLIALFGACKKNDDVAPGFDMNYQTDLTFQAGLGVDVVHHYYLKNIATNYQQYLSQHNKTDADIGSIITAQAVLSGVYGDENYDFIDEVELRIYKEPNTSDFIEIAYRYPVPISPGNNLPLIPNLPDIKKYLSDSRYSLDLGVRLRKITQEETQTRLTLQFRAAF